MWRLALIVLVLSLAPAGAKEPNKEQSLFDRATEAHMRAEQKGNLVGPKTEKPQKEKEPKSPSK